MKGGEYMKNNNFIKLAVVAFILGVFYLFYTAYAGAVKPEIFATICHHNPGNNVTLEFVNEQSYTGHLGTPHSDTVFDTEGACVEPTVEPTEEVTPTPEVTPDITATPTATPSGNVVPENPSDGRSDGLSSCPSCTQAPVVVPAGAPATGRAR